MSNAATDSTPVLFPAARYVSGDMYKTEEKKDQQGNVRTHAVGHKKAGEVMLECYFGIAIPKEGTQHWAQRPNTAYWQEKDPTGQGYNGFKVQHWGETIWLRGHADFPRLVDPASKMITLPSFAWKIEDGDSTIPKGERMIRNCDREGFPGCWIVHLKTPGRLPSIWDETGTHKIEGVGTVKRGFYIEVQGTVSGNGQTAKPGVYINHQMVAYRAPGKEIVFGPDPRSVGFGRSALPAGVTSVPTGAAASFPAGLPGAAQSGSPQPGFPLAGIAASPGAPASPGVGVPAGLPATGLPGASVGFPTASTAQTSPSSPAGLPGMPGAVQTAVQPQPGFLQPPAGLPQPIVVAPVLHPQLIQQGHTWASLTAQGITLDHAKSQGWIVG